MKLYKYKNYEDYIKSQIEANKRKIDLIWINDNTVRIISEKQEASNILCHGTRNGKEQELFQKYFPNAYVIGTEISDTATLFLNTIQHDFHEEKAEWLNKFDIVYTNSWDHSYDPDKSLQTWKNQLNENGNLYIEYVISNLRKSDPFQINHSEILDLFEKNRLEVIEIFDSIGGISNIPCKIYKIREKNML